MIIGIDPGLDGAITFMDGSKIVHYLDIPTLSDGKRRIVDLLYIKSLIITHTGKIRESNTLVFDSVKVIIEKAQSMPKNGATSMFNYGVSYGMLLGLCAGLGIAVRPVHPATWKKVMLKDMPKGKESSIIRVRELYPNLLLPRKKDHHVADSILIGLYGSKYV